MVSKFIDDVAAQIMTGLEYDKRRLKFKYALEEAIVRRILVRNLDALLRELQEKVCRGEAVINDVQRTEEEISKLSR